MGKALVSKADFPVLSRRHDGTPLIYLDSAATAQKPRVVLDAMDGFYRERYASVRRGIYALAEAATGEYEQARKTVATFLGTDDASEVVFTKNATESINLVAAGWGSRNLKKGDAILLTEMEHHANLVPWYRLAETQGLELRFGGVTGDGRLDLADFRKKAAGAKLVSVAHASNVLGTINPVAELAGIAHEAGAKILVDGAQAAPHLPVDVRALGADWYAVSGHKLYGPTGIGVLWTRHQVYTEMDVVFSGGEMITEVGLGTVSFADPPAKYEPGTPPVAEAIGLAAAAGYVEKLGRERIAAHDRELSAYALGKLGDVPGLRVFGPADPSARVGLVSFAVEGTHPHDLATLLDREGIAIRSGHHCAQPLHRRLGIPASTRASWGVYTAPADIDRLVEGLRGAVKTLT